MNLSSKILIGFGILVVIAVIIAIILNNKDNSDKKTDNSDKKTDNGKDDSDKYNEIINNINSVSEPEDSDPKGSDPNKPVFKVGPKNPNNIQACVVRDTLKVFDKGPDFDPKCVIPQKTDEERKYVANYCRFYGFMDEKDNKYELPLSACTDNNYFEKMDNGTLDIWDTVNAFADCGVFFCDWKDWAYTMPK